LSSVTAWSPFFFRDVLPQRSLKDERRTSNIEPATYPRHQ
jgi:hypothetical protein